MRLLPEINEALQEQCLVELTNVIKYKIISSYFEDLRLSKLAKKFKDQADEEYAHYTKVIDYINDRLGGKYIPVEVITPTIMLNSYLEAAKLYLETEISTTESLEALANLIEDEKSYIDRPFIDEMLHIQIEEERNADDFFKQVSLVHDIVLFDKLMEG